MDETTKIWVSTRIWNGQKGHTRFATVTLADVAECYKLYDCQTCSVEMAAQEAQENGTFECRALYERAKEMGPSAKTVTGNPLETWIERHGVNLDWEAKDALRRAVAEWMRMELPMTMPLEEER